MGEDNARVKSCPGIGVKAAEWLVAKDPMLLGSTTGRSRSRPIPTSRSRLPASQIAPGGERRAFVGEHETRRAQGRSRSTSSPSSCSRSRSRGLGLDGGAGRGEVSSRQAQQGGELPPPRRHEHAGRGGKDQREADGVRRRRPAPSSRTELESRYRRHGTERRARRSRRATD